MRRFKLLLLAAVTALVGCTNPHAYKPAAEMRAGITPITTKVPRNATYALVPLGQPDAMPLARAEVARDSRIGFRREPDRSVVAVAGELVLPLPDGEFAWVMVPGSGPSRRECAREDCHLLVREVKNAVFIAGLGLVIVAGAVLYALCTSNKGF